MIRDAVILAAGRGSRLMPYTKNRPKCMVLIGDRPILYYQLKALEKNGIRNITIVGGYREKQIQYYALKYFPHLNFNFLTNQNYSTTNDIVSLFVAKSHLGDNTLILDSDALLHPKIIEKLILFGKDAVALRRGVVAREEMKVKLNPNGTIARISKTLDPKISAGEFMCISLFSGRFLSALIYETERLIQNKRNWNMDREVAIEAVMKHQPLYAVDISEFPAIEIDFPEDLKRAEKEILPKILPYF